MTRALRCCYRCGKIAFDDKGLELFTKHAQSLHGRSNKCKACFSKEIIAARAVLQANVDAMKKGPCMDCGQKFDPVCMDFDHVRGEKKWSIAVGIRRAKPWSEIEEEIDKCELVCSNCHRVRTWRSGRRYPRKEGR